MKNKELLLKYLQSHDIIVISTIGERPTACTVYYGIDDNFNFYIVTPPSTEHGKNIAKNHQVACAITDTNQKMFKTKYKIGVQVYGTVHEIKDIEEMRKALRIWSKNQEDIVEKYMENITKKIYQSRPFIIQPTEIKWFNEELYGDEGIEVFKF